MKTLSVLGSLNSFRLSWFLRPDNYRCYMMLEFKKKKTDIHFLRIKIIDIFDHDEYE